MTLLFFWEGQGQELDPNPQPNSIDELLTSMLRDDPNDRPTAEECLAFGWFSNGAPIPTAQQV